MTSNANLQNWPRAQSPYHAPGLPACYCHPGYTSQYQKWGKYGLAYAGGEEARQAFLMPHERERSASFSARLKRSIYPNHIDVVVSTYASHLFRLAPSRGTQSELLQGFWENINQGDADADELFGQVARLVQVFGGVGVLVDRRDPGTEEDQPTTRAEEAAVGRRPYASIVRPEDVVDWEYDGAGEFEWVMIRESFQTRRRFNQPYSMGAYRYRRWTRFGWELYRVEENEDYDPSAEDGGEQYYYQLEDEGEHPVGYVPFHTTHWGTRLDGTWFGTSAIMEFVPMMGRLLNLLSLTDEQIYQIIFPILQVPFAVWAELEKVEFAVTGAIPCPDEGNGCEWLSPPVEPVGAIQKQVTSTEQSIRYLSGIGRQNDDGKQAQSGLAMAYQSSDKRALIEQFARRMERMETQVAQTAERWMEQTPSDPEVNYRVEITPEEIEGALKDALQFESLNMGGEAALENQRQAVKAHLGRYVSHERLAEILADLENKPEASEAGSNSYALTNALRVGALAPSPDLIRAMHAASGAPAPTEEEAREQAILLEEKQNQTSIDT